MHLVHIREEGLVDWQFDRMLRGSNIESFQTHHRSANIHNVIRNIDIRGVHHL